MIPNFADLDEALAPAPATAPGHRADGGPGQGCAPARTGSLPVLVLDPARPERPPGQVPGLVPRPVPPRGRQAAVGELVYVLVIAVAVRCIPLTGRGTFSCPSAG
jgi:hypothetical protein